LHALLVQMRPPHDHRKRSDDADAFVPEPTDGARLPADDAESFAEEFIASATKAEPEYQDAEDEVVEEEQGGPFLIETQLEPEPEPDTEREPPPKPPPSRRSRPVP
jgi:hypothetical protein